MEDYMKLLIEQFKAATGTKNVDEESQEFILEFADWVRSRMKISNQYIKLLEYMDLEKFKESSTIEVGKGCYDSIVIPYQTTIVTPFTDNFEGVNYDRLIRIEGLAQVKGEPTITYSTSANKLVDVKIPPQVRTLMTQNPYTKASIKDWNVIHNKGNADIIVGIYGSVYDKDANDKLRHIETFAKDLDDSIILDTAVENDCYSVIVASDKKTKKRIKVK